jgi:hypothetical protein
MDPRFLQGCRAEGEKEMARAYSGVLAAVALSLAITRGLVLGMSANEVLIQCLWFFFVFALVGYFIGTVAEKIVRESVESRFREEIAAVEARTGLERADTPEQ